MSKASELNKQLRLPVIGAPLFTVSYPELVIAQCSRNSRFVSSSKCKTSGGARSLDK